MPLTPAGPPPLEPAETRLLWLLGIYVVFSSWIAGMQSAWTLPVGAVLAAACFAVALSPRLGRSRDGRTPGQRLLRFAPLWFFVAFAVYLLLQHLNPAWTFRLDGQHWWMEPRSHVTWLPHGVDAPMLEPSGHPQRYANALRYILFFGSPALVAAAAAAGITRRRSAQILLWILLGNATALALVAFAQRVTGAEGVLWFWKSGYQFWSTFHYRNHAAAFFYVHALLGAGLAIHAFREAARRNDRRHATPMILCVSGICALAAGASGSRAGLILCAASLAVLAGVALNTALPERLRRLGVLAAAVCALLIVVLGGWLLPKTLTRSVSAAAADPEILLSESRLSLARATLDMVADAPVYGSGAASFRYLFTRHQYRYPELFVDPTYRRPRYWQEAHNDLLQGVAEFGIVGILPLLAMLVWWGRKLLQPHYRGSPLVQAGLVAAATLLLHAGADFILQHPATLATLALALTVPWLYRRQELLLRERY